MHDEIMEPERITSDSLEGRTAIVTGAARGLGEAIARALHGAGVGVLLADLDVEGVERVVESLGAGSEAVAVDVRSRTDIERVVEHAVGRWGRLDIMVNNAARTVHRSFWEIDSEEWDDVLAVNLRSVFFGCQIAGERMRKQGFGRIVNLASIAGQVGGTVAGAHYSASKAGIIVLTKLVARELAPYGVTANAVAPAAVKGPVMDVMPADRLEAVRQAIPVGRFGEPAEVAALVLFLVSDHASFVTGATYDINGGLLMR